MHKDCPPLFLFNSNLRCKQYACITAYALVILSYDDKNLTI